jgi:hypothetical protein
MCPVLPGGPGAFDTFNSTIFRLPLREESRARNSELSDQTVTRETIGGLYARYWRDTFNCPLFLNSFRSIQLKEIDE